MEIKERFQQYFEEIFGSDYEIIKNSFLSSRIPAIRVNTLKAIPSEVQLSLENKGFKLEPIKGIDYGFFVKEKPFPIGNTLEHSIGVIYSQTASSMLPVIALQPSQTDAILDIAAAPGSKTTQIGMLMNNKGLIIANDVSPERLNVLALNVQRMGLMNVAITRGDASNIKFGMKFDKILVDAPCSATGTIDSNEISPMKMWSKKGSKRLARTQFKLLLNAWEHLNDDGILVYSTCSIDPVENELLIDKFMDKVNAKIMKINLEEMDFKRKILDLDVNKEIIRKSIRIMPDQKWEGFFLVKLKKE